MSDTQARPQANGPKTGTTVPRKQKKPKGKLIAKQRRLLTRLQTELNDLSGQHKRHQAKLAQELQTELAPFQRAWDQKRQELEKKYNQMFQELGQPRQDRISWLQQRVASINAFLEIAEGRLDVNDTGPQFDYKVGEFALNGDGGSADPDEDELEDPEDLGDEDDSEVDDGGADDEGSNPDLDDEDEEEDALEED